MNTNSAALGQPAIRTLILKGIRRVHAGNNTHPRLAVSPAEAANIIGVGRTRLYELLDQGRIASLKCGRRRLITVAALEQFLTDLAVGGDAA